MFPYTSWKYTDQNDDLTIMKHFSAELHLFLLCSTSCASKSLLWNNVFHLHINKNNKQSETYAWAKRFYKWVCSLVYNNQDLNLDLANPARAIGRCVFFANYVKRDSTLTCITFGTGAHYSLTELLKKQSNLIIFQPEPHLVKLSAFSQFWKPRCFHLKCFFLYSRGHIQITWWQLSTTAGKTPSPKLHRYDPTTQVGICHKKPTSLWFRLHIFSFLYIKMCEALSAYLLYFLTSAICIALLDLQLKHELELQTWKYSISFCQVTESCTVSEKNTHTEMFFDWQN